MSGDAQLELFDNAAPQPKGKPKPIGRASSASGPPGPPSFKHLAQIAVDAPLADSFTYIADQVVEGLALGARVLVPFGHRTIVGFYIGAQPELGGVNPSRLKSILKVLDQPENVLLTPTLLKLAHWIARRYAAPLGATLSAMLPAGVKRGAAPMRIRMVAALRSVPELFERAQQLEHTKPKQAAVLLALIANLQSDETQQVSAPILLHEAEAPESALRALEKAKLIQISAQRPAAGPAFDHAGAQSHDLQLTEEQRAALTTIDVAVDGGQCAGFLLQGVTGSGKTEVYLRALKHALEHGRQGIVLVPEIALTPQTAQRFEQRLGGERIAVLHSHLTDGERAEAWHAVRQGKIDVVVGARSALFAPLPRLGLIVIDEEHENAFKQESTPRYHARDVALELARLTQSVLVLGSATPSFEALHAARTGVLSHLVLSHRVAGRPLPPVEIIDMSQENRELQRYTFLSRRLLDSLSKTLARREQAILFINRRGYATVITCLRCGFTEKCSQCDITLTSHRAGGGNLSCHYCGLSKPVPPCCANCSAPGLKHWGLGTERIELEVQKAFPQARVARMDSDTMTQRTAYLDALGNFRAGKTDILIGTQMIAKGLDFPNVTLVGVVLADTALHMPDFRSRERTFQLLAQVAGRAGRSEKGGRVVVQTHLPTDPAIKAAATHDYETFALNELQERRAYHYPPYLRLARIIVRGQDLKATRAAAQSIADALKAHCASKPSAQPLVILGPAEAPLAKLEGYFRQHIMLKAQSSEALSEFLLGPARESIAKLKQAEAVIDVDAVGML